MEATFSSVAWSNGHGLKTNSSNHIIYHYSDNFRTLPKLQCCNYGHNRLLTPQCCGFLDKQKFLAGLAGTLPVEKLRMEFSKILAEVFMKTESV